MTKQGLYKFQDGSSTGIELVPINGYIFIENTGGTNKSIMIIDKSDITFSTTIDELLALTSQWVDIGSGGGISLSDVTYEALYDNGDVGTGSSQVSRGSHTHSYDNYNGWDLQVNTGTANRITSGENVNFKGSGATSISLSGSTVTISSTSSAYTHPTYTSRSESGDSGVMAGATVISDLDFNLSSDSTGHVTSCDITRLSTRELTASDIGAQPAGSYDNYGSWNYKVDSSSTESITSGDTLNFMASTAITLWKGTDTINIGVELGTSSSQAAYGNHNHDGVYSPVSHNHDAEYEITSGSNGSGNWVKYPDGTMIQWGTSSLSSGGTGTISFPLSFNSTPTVALGATSTAPSDSVLIAVSMSSVSTSSCTFHTRYTSGGAVGVTNEATKWIAAGKWK